MLSVSPTALDGVKLVVPKSFPDSRGAFCEVYNRRRYFEHGIEIEFVQDNESISAAAGTIRGLHLQKPPTAQDKLVRVLRGSIFDVAVDLRRSSPTYGRWVGEVLSSDNRKQLLVPAGFAHGFCTLEPDTHVSYKVSNYYSVGDELGIAWNDPDLAIDWPIDPAKAVLSDKDARLPRFGALPAVFE